MRHANLRAVLFLLVSFNTCLTAQRQANLPSISTASPVYFSLPPEGLRQTDLLGTGARLLATRNDDWEATSSQWSHRDSIIYLYDGLTLSQAQTLRFDGNAWKLSSREIYGYDLGNRTLSQRQSWDGSNWKDVSRTVYQYDANNNRIFTINQNSNGTDWLNVNLVMYSYDANGNQTKVRRQKYLGNGWIDQTLEVLEYDANQLRTEQTKQTWDVATNTWVNTQKISYHYSTARQMDQELLRIWKNEAWELAVLATYSYQDSLLAEVTRGSWTGFTWSNYSKEVYAYHQNPRLLSDLTTLLWQSGDWKNHEKSTCSYDANHNKVYQLRQAFVNGAWQNMEQSFSYYESVVSAPAQASLAADFHISPNPGKGLFTLDFASTEDPATQLVVSDLQGRQLSTLALSGQSSEKLDLQFLPNGVYWLRLRTAKGKLGVRQVQILR